MVKHYDNIVICMYYYVYRNGIILVFIFFFLTGTLGIHLTPSATTSFAMYTIVQKTTSSQGAYSRKLSSAFHGAGDAVSEYYRCILFCYRRTLSR
jgi:hypothetical protein